MFLKLLSLLQIRTLVVHQLTPLPALPVANIRSLQTSAYQFQGQCSKIVHIAEHLQDLQIRPRIVLTADGLGEMDIIRDIQQCYPWVAVICVIIKSAQIDSNTEDIVMRSGLYKCCDLLLVTAIHMTFENLVLSSRGLDVYSVGPLESSCGRCALFKKGGAVRSLRGSVMGISGLNWTPMYYFQRCEGPWSQCSQWTPEVSTAKIPFKPPPLSQKNPYKGFESRFAETIATALNFTLYIRISKFPGYYGSGFKDGEPDGILGLLIDRRVMLVIGDLTLNHVRLRFSDFASPHDFDNWGVVTHIEEAPLTLEFFLSLLGGYSVLGFLVLMVLTFSVLVVAKPFSLSRVWLCLAFTCQPSDPSPLQHEKGGAGVVVASWLLGTYLVLSIISAVLTVYTVMPAMVQIPSTLQQAVQQSNEPFNVFTKYARDILFRIAQAAPVSSPERRLFLEIHDRCKVVPFSEARAALQQKSSTRLLSTESTLIPLRFMFKEDVTIGARFVPERVMLFTQGIALQKGCRYNTDVNRVVRRLQVTGLLEKFKQLAGIQYLDSSSRSVISYEAIGLDNIVTFFVVCGYLFIASLSVFIVEHLSCMKRLRS